MSGVWRRHRRLLRVYDVPHKGLLWGFLAVRSEGRYNSHEGGDDDNGLELISAVDHILHKEMYFANDARHYSNVEVIDRSLETTSDWRVGLWHPGRGTRL